MTRVRCDACETTYVLRDLPTQQRSQWVRFHAAVYGCGGHTLTVHDSTAEDRGEVVYVGTSDAAMVRCYASGYQAGVNVALAEALDAMRTLVRRARPLPSVDVGEREPVALDASPACPGRSMTMLAGDGPCEFPGGASEPCLFCGQVAT